MEKMILAVLCSVGLFASCRSLGVQKLNWLVPCETNDDCSIYFNATCDNQLCYCDNELYTCEEMMKMWLVNKVGEECQAIGNCNFKGAECNPEGKCVCEEGLVASQNGRKCLKASLGIGDICEDDMQCTARTASTRCQNNKCVCQPHMHEMNGSCYYTDVGSFRNCTASQGCQGLKGLDSECDSDRQCAADMGGGAFCSFKKCKCKDLYNFKTTLNKCVRDHLLGDVCANNTDCYQPGTEPDRLECILGVCNCRPPYMEEHGYCISGATILSNVFCTFLILLSSSYLL